MQKKYICLYHWYFPTSIKNRQINTQQKNTKWFLVRQHGILWGEGIICILFGHKFVDSFRFGFSSKHITKLCRPIATNTVQTDVFVCPETCMLKCMCLDLQKSHIINFHINRRLFNWKTYSFLLPNSFFYHQMVGRLWEKNSSIGLTAFSLAAL